MKIITREKPTLYKDSSLTSFLGITPSDTKGWEKSQSNLHNRKFLRNELSEILHSYNQSIGNDSIALKKIKEFQHQDSICVFTGQQLGFMGGPTYTILKAITCLALAKEHRAIPIFWLATEDHDVDEIDHTFLIDVLGNLKKYHLSIPKDGRFVEDIELNQQQIQVVESFLEAVDQKALFSELSSETSYAKMMAKVLIKLFRGTGMVFMEPRLIRSLAIPFFCKEIEYSDEINDILKDTSKRFVEAGGKLQLEIAEGTNLFMKTKGMQRNKIKKLGKKFYVGTQEYTREQLLEAVKKSPEIISTNAAARPILQSILFPTAAYVAGPGELAYYHQLKDYHEFHEISMPWIVPRMSATFITPEANGMLEKCNLKPWEKIPKHWLEVMPNLEDGIEEVAADWQKSGVKHLSPEISQQAILRFIRNSAQQLKRKITQIKLKQKGIPTHSLHYLNNLLHPHEKLQERVINWWEFQSQTEENVVLEMLKGADHRFQGHYYCYLS
jgi:bacillithiol biosynthesis cysteine-adding enzyme BshC